MTPPPHSKPSARPSRSPRARIVRALRSRYFLYPFLGGVVGELQGNLGVNRVNGFVGGVLVVGTAVRSFWRNRNSQGLSGVRKRRARDRGAMPPVSGLMAGAGWRVMRAAARLMPRAAGSRWLAEAGSFLSEAPPAQRRRALRNYLATAPLAILVSWAGHLGRRTRAR